MGDSLYISKGLLDDDTNVSSGNLDRAIAGTMAHEIGHSLCLSDSKIWEEQPNECVFAAIDNNDDESEFYNLEDYESVMNYRYQLTYPYDLGIVQYSDGANITDDHKDLEAIALGIGKFSGAHTLFSEGARINLVNSTTPPESAINDEAPRRTVEETKHLEEAVKNYEDTLSSIDMSQERKSEPSPSDKNQTDNMTSDEEKNKLNNIDHVYDGQWTPLLIAGAGMLLLIMIFIIIQLLVRKNN